MSVIVPARFPSGLSASRNDTDLLGRYTHINPLMANFYENDFNTYVATDWTIVTAGTGSNALSPTLGGALLLTTNTAASNQAITLSNASFAFVPGYQVWFSAAITMTSLTTQTGLQIGLIAGGAAAPTSGVYFTKAAGSNNINGVLNKGGTLTTLTTITTMAQNTQISLGIYYDGRPTSNLYFYSSTGLTGSTTSTPSPTAFGQVPIYGGVRVASASNDGLNPNPLTNLPLAATLVAPSVLVSTNSATVGTVLLDYMVSACEVLRF